VPGAAQDRQARIFRKIGIGLRELAEEELRAFLGDDEPRMNAIGAETERVGVFGLFFTFAHILRNGLAKFPQGLKPMFWELLMSELKLRPPKPFQLLARL
jgi:hypothetical protein